MRFPKPDFVMALFCGSLLLMGLLTDRKDLLFMGALAAGVLLLMTQGDKK